MSMSGRRPPALLQLTYLGQEDEIKKLLEETKAKFSAINSDPEYIKSALKKMVDEQHEWCCAVRAAVEGNRYRILQILINAGANLDVKMSGGQSPIEYAQKLGFTKVVKLLEATVGERANHELPNSNHKPF